MPGVVHMLPHAPAGQLGISLMQSIQESLVFEAGLMGVLYGLQGEDAFPISEVFEALHHLDQVAIVTPLDKE